MSNLPEKYSQEAQDKRDLAAKLEGQSPKSRLGWSYAHISDKDWPFRKKKKCPK